MMRGIMDEWSDEITCLLIGNLAISLGAKYLQSSLFSEWNVVIQLATYLLSLTCAISTAGLDFVIRSPATLNIVRIARIFILFFTNIFLSMWGALVTLGFHCFDLWIVKVSPGFKDMLNRDVCILAIFAFLWKFWRMRQREKPNLSKARNLRITSAGFNLMMIFIVSCIVSAAYDLFLGIGKTSVWVSSFFNSLDMALVFVYLSSGDYTSFSKLLWAYCMFAIASLPPVIYSSLLYREFSDLLDVFLIFCGLSSEFLRYLFRPLLAVNFLFCMHMACTWKARVIRAIRIWDRHLSRMAPAA